MAWPLMSADELHIFGLEVILPYLVKEGLTIQSVNRDPGKNPQVVGQSGGSLAFIFVRTTMYPDKGELSEAMFMRCREWAEQHQADPFFASVGLACLSYPGQSPVTSDADMRLPIRHAGFAVAYEGLVNMTTSDRVRLFKQDD